MCFKNNRRFILNIIPHWILAVYIKIKNPFI